MHPNPKTTPLVRGTTPEIQQAARELRWQRQTAAEAALWEALKGKQLGGLKFRRQHAVGPSILDFWRRPGLNPWAKRTNPICDGLLALQP